MNHFRMIKRDNKMECLECGKILSGSNKNNIVRHYRLVHKKEISLLRRRKGATPAIPKIENTPPPDEPLNNREDFTGALCLTEAYSLRANTPGTINIDRNHFLKCCLGLIAVKNMPLDIFDDQEFFKTLISPYEETFKTNLNSQNFQNVLESSCNKIQDIIRNRVKNQMISLKIDIAKRMEGSILGINIVYIANSKICIDSLGIIPLDGRPKFSRVKELILKCLETYEIKISQIYSCTTDSGQIRPIIEKHIKQEYATDDDGIYEINEIEDNVRDSLTSEVLVLKCAAHVIQLAAYDVIKEIRIEIAVCERIVKKIRNLIWACVVNKPIPVLDIPKVIPTQWNSVYEMFKSLLNYRFINSEIFDTADTENDINWDFMSDFVVAFSPLVKFSEQLELKQYVLGDFYRDWLNCEIELEDITSSTAEFLHAAMQYRKPLLLKNDDFVAALYLDPRFNFINSTMITEEQKTRALTHLVKTFDTMQKLECSSIKMELSDDADEETPTSSPAYAKLTQRIMSSATRGPRYSETKQTFTQKLIALSNSKMISLDTDILEYWHNNSQDTDILKVVNVALAVPANNVSFEQTFSAIELTKQDNQLNYTILNNLLLTKLHFAEINSYNVELDISNEQDLN